MFKDAGSKTKMDNENAVASISNSVIGISGSVNQVQIMLSTLASFDPSRKLRDNANGIEDERRRIIEEKYFYLDRSQVERMRSTIEIESITNFYDSNSKERTFKVDYRTFCQTWKKENLHDEHTNLTKACDSLVSLTMTENFVVINEKGKEINRRRTISPITTAEIEGFDHILIQIHHGFMPHIIKLNEIFAGLGYTKMPLCFLAPCRTKSSLSLMMLIIKKFWGTKGSSQSFTISINDLKKECGISGSYPEFKIFNRDWLKPAMEVINKNEDVGSMVNVSVEPIRKRRSITELKFNVISNDLLKFKNKKIGNRDIAESRNIARARNSLKPTI